MVARITPTARVSDLLLYNEKKVTQNEAKLIGAGNFLLNKDQLSYEDKLHRFQKQNQENSRAKLKMLHVTLNFSPEENLSDKKMAAIADRYMKGMDMEKQPYLVYRHEDAAHPHLHIVTSLIRDDGCRINTHHLGIRLSEPARKSIEKEFGLLPNRPSQSWPILKSDELQMIVPGSGIPVSRQIETITATINNAYSFSNLDEYNAILRGYNVTVETGKPGSKTHEHGGLYYLALDDDGRKISPPVMASQLPNRPTYAQLEKKFHQPGAKHEEYLLSVRQRIDLELFYQPANIREFVEDLRPESIEIVMSARKNGDPPAFIYVDHWNHIAVEAHRLGPAYTAESVLRTLSENHSRASDLRLQRTLSFAMDERGLKASGFNPRVPQTLFSVFSALPEPREHQLDQHLGQRLRR